MSNLLSRSCPQHRGQARPRRAVARSWLLTLLALAGAGLLGACVLEHDASSADDWQTDTQASELAVTCEPPRPSTDPDVVRRQAIAALITSNQFYIDPATGQPLAQGCLGTNSSHCLWLCQDGDPLDDAENCSGTLCCPGCGGSTDPASGAPTDAYPCD